MGRRKGYESRLSRSRERDGILPLRIRREKSERVAGAASAARSRSFGMRVARVLAE